MSTCFQQSPVVEKVLISEDTTVKYEWLTAWNLATGADHVRAVLKAKQGVSGFQYQLAIQTATVRPDNPNGGPTAIGAQQTYPSNTEYCTGDLDITSYTGGSMWFRLGIAYNSSSAAVTQAIVSLVATWIQIGELVGTTTVQMEANDTGNRFAVLTKWFPAQYWGNLKVAFVVNGVTGSSNLQYKLITQTAPTSLQQPGSWNTGFEGSWRTLSSGTNVETNTGELAVSTSDMWMRIGLVYALGSGSTLTSATLTAIVSMRD